MTDTSPDTSPDERAEHDTAPASPNRRGLAVMIAVIVVASVVFLAVTFSITIATPGG